MSTLRTRSDQIIEYLRQHREEIEAAPSVSVTFDCGDGGISAKLTRFDKIKRPPVDACPAMD